MKRDRIDLLVGSVGGLNKMFQGNLFFADHIETIMFDEIDTLIDDTFIGVTLQLLSILRKKMDQQLIFVGKYLWQKILVFPPTCRILPKSSQTWIEAPYEFPELKPSLEQKIWQFKPTPR